MNHLTDTSIKHDVKYVSANVPVDNRPIIAVHLLVDVEKPITLNEAFRLVMFAAENAGLNIRDCGIDDFTVAHGTLSLELGT